jgi:uncharacterized membrane protein
MTALAAAYVSILVVFGALDFVWLSLTHATLYKPALASLLADRIAVVPAAAFYVLYLAGVVYFAVAPALAGGGWSRALANGALFGLIAYATYDLTNQATLRGWPLRITIADMGWGAVATGLAALISFSIAAWSARTFS